MGSSFIVRLPAQFFFGWVPGVKSSTNFPAEWAMISPPSILRTNGSVNVRWSRLIASMVRMGWADNWTRASPRLDKDWKTMEESWDDNWKIDEPSFLYG